MSYRLSRWADAEWAGLNSMDRATRERLTSEIVDAARNAFSAVRQAHAEERFYAFALYTEPDLGYLVPSCNSEEGLARKVGSFTADELRWNPCDWAYHLEGESFFAPVQPVLEGLPPIYQQPDPDAAFDDRFNVFASALRRLDADEFFGAGREREHVVVNVLWGDQDLRFHLSTARQLNPPAAFRRYAADELPQFHRICQSLEGQSSIEIENELRALKSLAQEIEEELATDGGAQ